MLNIRKISASIFAIAAVLILFAGCSDSKEGGANDSSRAWLVAETVNYEITTNKIETEGSDKLTCRATILSQGAEEWCSFDLKTQQTEYSGKVGNPIYIYLQQNMTDRDRTAQIEVTFSDSYTTTLTLTQTGYSETAGYFHSWGEQPEFRSDASFIYKTYYADFIGNQYFSGGYLRNYSVCYDTEKRVSRWVAYPVFKKVYETPALSRVNKFGYDPNDQLPVIPEGLQQYIGRGYGVRGYDRGHMLPQASRYNNYGANAMTYYATNMMPQHSNFNQHVWASLEGKVRGWGGLNKYDTLYVVTGASFKNSTTIPNANGPITVPSHCWKVLLRQRGDVNKQISEFGADELKAIGFIFTNDDAGAATTIRDAACTVREVEELSGFEFFRNLSPAAAETVKTRLEYADWGL